MGLMACSGSGDALVSEPPAGNGNDGGTQGQPHAVGFSASFAKEEGGAAPSRTNSTTRGVGDGEYGLDEDAPNKELQASGFGVYCWYTGTNTYETGTHIKDYTENILMLNQRVEYKNGQWTYSPSKYWPLADNEKLTFRAYAPYVSYQLQTDATTGLPMLPVVVTANDYRNGTQHDPLWGTARHGGSDGDAGATYGVLYDNYTYTMSGDQTSKDSRDGVVDWYFHHGMSKLMFTVSVTQDAGCDSVKIRSIEIKDLYKQGLLSLNSLTEQNTDKPTREQRSGDMTVTLSENETKMTEKGDFAPAPEPDPLPENYIPYPFVIRIANPSEATAPAPLLSKGLLIIPRDFEEDGLKVTVTYSIDTDDVTTYTAKATVKKIFYGNTSYILGLSLTPSTQGLEITTLQSAFTAWADGGELERWVYNW